MDLITKSNFDEEEWVVQISGNLKEELEEAGEIELPVAIFNVPKPLLISNPNSYVPQQIVIGPCNYSTPQHREMERYKIAAAKRMQKTQATSLNFHHLVEQVKRHDQRIRALYQRYLYLNSDTLAWMVALDSCFLLEFLGDLATRKEGNKELPTAHVVPPNMSDFNDYAGRTESAYNAILRDIAMLENQIPLFLLKEVLEFRCSLQDSAGELLISMLIGLCKEISPFKATINNTKLLPNVQVLETRCAHLLDFLYRTIVPKLKGTMSNTADHETNDVEMDEEQDEVKGENSFENSRNVQQILNMIWKASDLKRGPLRKIKQFLFKPIQVVSKLPWTSVYNFPGMTRWSKELMETEKINKAGGNSNNIDDGRPPLVEEIKIPSVTELSKAGVSFAPTGTGGIFSINFDAKRKTLFLPVVSLDVNSEVVLRNLVAYESCSRSGPLVFTRYTELMNGIIDADEDVKILRKQRIIVSHLKRDGEVAKLWNGMGRSIRLTKVDFLDKTIVDVNKYYNGRLKIKFKRLVTRYVFESWKFLTLFASLLMLWFMGVQAFCSVYSCPRILNRVQNLQ